MIKVVLFDLDGTLTDSSEGITKSIQYALGKHGIEEPDLENLRKFIGPPLVPAFMECYGVTEDEAHSIRNTFNERYVPIGWKENRPYDGIEAVLESIQTEGKMLGIATSKPQETADKVLEYFDLKKYFTKRKLYLVISLLNKNGIIEFTKTEKNKRYYKLCETN